MSIISTRSTTQSISSILKGSGVRAKLVGPKNRVNFKLPKDIRSILINFEGGYDIKAYEELTSILWTAPIQDEELIELLDEVRQCIALLGDKHKRLVEALLKIEWTTRPKLIPVYKDFLEDLICAHSYYCKSVMDRLLAEFRPPPKKRESEEGVKELETVEEEWENGVPSEKDLEKFSHVHDLLFKFLKIVPMSSTILLQCISSNYPYMKLSTHAHEMYLHSLLQIIDYAPQLRSDILSLIINRLVMLDVNAPRSEIESYRQNDEVFHLEEEYKEHPLAHTLDVCMKKIFNYIYETCHPHSDNQDCKQDKLDPDSMRPLFHELIVIFEKIILPTYASHHVQFIMFYIVSFKVNAVEIFLNRLWDKVSNPNVAPVIRQSAVAYISSLLARGKFVPIAMLLEVLSKMAEWVHSYVTAQDSLECANSDVRVHTVFYAVCQAMFYVVAFRNKDLVENKKILLILQGLNFNKIISCRLNPLKFCLPNVVTHFASVARNHQLAYCYTIIEHNARMSLPIAETSNRCTTWLDTFFPFDPYVLRQSVEIITPFYLQYQGSTNVDTTSNVDTTREDNDNDDDYMDVCYSHNDDNPHMDKFSYSTSPGYIQT